MSELKDTEISKAIISTYHDKLLNRIAGDVLIVGGWSVRVRRRIAEENDLNAHV